MKKLIGTTLIVLLVVIGQESFAQDDEVGGLRFGFHNSAMYKDGNMFPGSVPYQTFYIGLFRDNKVAPLFYLGSGLEYFQNGAKINDDNKTVLHYISVPLNVKLKIGPAFGITGFAPSFRLSEQKYILGVKSTPSGDDKSDWFDIPFILGAGVKVLFVTVEARYHWGLRDVKDSYRNQYFQLGAGISF